MKREALIWSVTSLSCVSGGVGRTGMLNADKTQVQEELTEAQQRIALLDSSTHGGG